MDTRTTTITAALALAGLQIGLFAWLETDIAALADRMVAVERDVARVESQVAFVRGQLSLALPALARPPSNPPATSPSP